MGELILVTGGSRSGKSAFAEKLAERLAVGRGVVYLATGSASDPEMAERIAQHRLRRPPDWETLEVGPDLDGVVGARVLRGKCLLLDCLTGWIGARLAEGWPRQRVLAGVEAMEARLADADAPRVVVSGEVGCGVVPPTPLGREFRDAVGEANQRLAGRAGAVYLVVAGMALNLKKYAEDEFGR